MRFARPAVCVPGEISLNLARVRLDLGPPEAPVPVESTDEIANEVDCYGNRKDHDDDAHDESDDAHGESRAG